MIATDIEAYYLKDGKKLLKASFSLDRTLQDKNRYMMSGLIITSRASLNDSGSYQCSLLIPNVTTEAILSSPYVVNIECK